MKLYVTRDIEPGTQSGEGLYRLISEEGECINSWLSSSKYWAKIDLYDAETQEICKEKFGDDVTVLFLGDDVMTFNQLYELAKNFNYK